MSDEEISSPCKREENTETETCEIEQGRCTTCGRTRDDIVTWATKTEDERQVRMEELEEEGFS